MCRARVVPVYSTHEIKQLGRLDMIGIHVLPNVR